jgi:hypothetical protein
MSALELPLLMYVYIYIDLYVYFLIEMIRVYIDT